MNLSGITPNYQILIKQPLGPKFRSTERPPSRNPKLVYDIDNRHHQHILLLKHNLKKTLEKAFTILILVICRARRVILYPVGGGEDSPA